MSVRWLRTHERLLKKGGQVMTTLTINDVCKKHTPNKSAISNHGDDQFTFCEVCENNIERWYNDTDPERLPMWTEWKVSK
jgi:hypothetical protein